MQTKNCKWVIKIQEFKTLICVAPYLSPIHLVPLALAGFGTLFSNI